MVGLFLTAFLQATATVLIAGRMVVKNNALLGLGLMLAAGEIPRIANQFALDTSKANLIGAVYTSLATVPMSLPKPVIPAVN